MIYLNGPQGISLGTIQTAQRVIRVVSVAMYPTYRFSALLVGLPTSEENTKVMASIVRHAAKPAYGSPMKIVVQPPTLKTGVTNCNETYEFLPNFVAVVELEADATDPSSMFSSLRLVLFTSDPDLKLIDATILNAVERLDWAASAENWTP